MKESINEYRFKGLNYKPSSNNYFTMNRFDEEKTKICVRISKKLLIKTQYGYALILDRTHVVFLKKWQVCKNLSNAEVLLDIQYFHIKEWGVHPNHEKEPAKLDFDWWLNLAMTQEYSLDEQGYKLYPVEWKR